MFIVIHLGHPFSCYFSLNVYFFVYYTLEDYHYFTKYELNSS